MKSTPKAKTVINDSDIVFYEQVFLDLNQELQSCNEPFQQNNLVSQSTLKNAKAKKLF